MVLWLKEKSDLGRHQECATPVNCSHQTVQPIGLSRKESRILLVREPTFSSFAAQTKVAPGKGYKFSSPSGTDRQDHLSFETLLFEHQADLLIVGVTSGRVDSIIPAWVRKVLDFGRTTVISQERKFSLARIPRISC